MRFSKILSTGPKQLLLELGTSIQWEHNSSKAVPSRQSHTNYFWSNFILNSNKSHLSLLSFSKWRSQNSNAKNNNDLISSFIYINISMEISIHCQSVLVCPLFKKNRRLEYSFGTKPVFLTTQVICACMKSQNTGCHKIRPCKISFRKHVT